MLSLLLTVACDGNQRENSASDEAETAGNPSTNEPGHSDAEREEKGEYSAANGSEAAADEEKSIQNAKIKLTFDHEEVIVNMYDNPTSRDLLRKLLLTLTFEDFNGFEKILNGHELLRRLLCHSFLSSSYGKTRIWEDCEYFV
ncbi:cyclophilin-like fold protein [Geobacillus kaustophilus]|uniref:cyclophilin-like fold protein n=1 Tax=Geobacillus thermoleovorans group TaxID=1505648 RepID=UPI00142D3413